MNPTDNSNNFDLPDLDTTTSPPPAVNATVNDSGLPEVEVATVPPVASVDIPPMVPPVEPPQSQITINTDQPVQLTTKKKSNAGPFIIGALLFLLLVGGGAFVLFGQTLLSTFRGDVRQQAALVPACRDGKDNDNDGKIDCVEGVADPGCFPDNNGGGGACNPNDENEANAVAAPVVQADVLACSSVLFYWNSAGVWTKDTAANIATKVAPNTEIRLAVKPVDNTADAARFRVNEGNWMETRTKNEAGEFYVAYSPASFATFKVETQIGAYGYEN